MTELALAIRLEVAYQHRLRGHGGAGVGSPYKTTRKAFGRLRWVRNLVEGSNDYADINFMQPVGRR